MKKLYKLLCLILGLLPMSYAQTVDIEKISGSKSLKVSGGLNASALFTQGMPDGNSPFNYFLSGYLNFTAFNAVNIPLMINYSDRKVNMSQGYSFNQISIHPTYKWGTAHIGTTNMNFSPYTLNGHQFTGAGLELSPKNWKIQLMSGRLLKGQYEDTLNTGPTFKRTGMGYRIEYNPGKFHIGTTLFKAKDQAGSIPEIYRKFGEQVINPYDNLVMGLHFGAMLWSKLQLNGELANSLITKDSSPLYESRKINSLAGLFYKGNATTESNNALKLKANYKIKNTGTILGVGYERIDPNYTTLGGYYFVNDLVNYTVNVNQILAKGKYSLNGSIGVQRDDIKKTKINKQNRFVGNLNAQANFSEKLSMNLMFSNFQSYRFLNDTYSRIERIPGQVIDTLDYSLVSTTLGYSLVSYLSKNEEKEVSLTFNTNYIASENLHGDQNSVKTNIINSATALVWRFPKSDFSIQAALSHFYNGLPDNKLTGIGPNIGLQKKVLDKLTLSLNTAIMQVKNRQPKDQYLSFNSQLAAGWDLTDNHRFNLNLGNVKNQQNNYLNGNIAYNYTFK